MCETEHTFRLVFFFYFFYLPKRIVKSVCQKAETEYTIRFLFLFLILTETDFGIRVGGG